MASAAEAAGDASTSAHEAREKPIVVRVKRKPSQTRPDAFWLEINERPVKKAMLDFSSISISEPSSTAKASEEPRVKKLLVQHIDTRTDLNAKEIKSKTKEWNDRIKKDKKQDQLRSAARQRHEVAHTLMDEYLTSRVMDEYLTSTGDTSQNDAVDLGRNARFAQIWRSRKGDKNEADESLRELCHLYDAVQVDSDGEKHPTEPRITSFEEGAILCNFLPLIREHLPSAAEEIESDIISLAQSEDSDVYDIYTVKEADDTNMEDTSAAPYPLLQVDDDDDDDCYNDDDYPYDTDDSNAEDNPLYDYPEEPSEDEDDDANGDNPFADIDCSGSEYEKEVVEEDDEAEYWR